MTGKTRMRDIAEGTPPPAPGCIRVELTSPGGLAVRTFRDGGVLMRVCAGHLDADDGLLAEMLSGTEPAPWASAAARDEAVSRVRRDVRRAEGEEREALVRLLEHVRRTPYYEDG